LDNLAGQTWERKEKDTGMKEGKKEGREEEREGKMKGRREGREDGLSQKKQVNEGTNA
jgi:hypothetical protein